MTGVLAQLVSWLNSGANALGSSLLIPIAALPGWASATLVGAVTGVLLLFVYKYTSPQRAVKRVRDDISANLLALKLFKDSAWVAVKSQGRLLRGAGLLLLLAVVPMLVMLVPVSLLLAQLHLWYHARPVPVGEETVVTMKVNGDIGDAWPDVRLQPNDAVKVADGPYRIKSERKICWNVEAKQEGYQRLVFEVNGQPIEKELCVGDGYMRVNTLRPGWSWYEILENPGEPPFASDSPVQAIDVEYAERDLTIVKLPWMAYWFLVSLVAGYCGSWVFNVNL